MCKSIFLASSICVMATLRVRLSSSNQCLGLNSVLNCKMSAFVVSAWRKSNILIRHSGINKIKYFSSNVDTISGDEIVIPQYIPRSSTDILEAIATTIRRDPTGPHYKYHDDPYLYPMTNYRKKIYALSQESGRKAAHWIKNEHRRYFLYTISDPPLRKLSPYQNADPPIEAFLPKPIYDENTDVSEEDLKTLIKNHLVFDAITVYKLLESKNQGAISSETMQKFLELVCFFNEEDPFPDEWLEEKWFRESGTSLQKRITNWKKDGLAMSIFSNMAEKTPAAYCTLILGMCKHYQAQDAFELYEECCQNGILLNTNVYNGLISVVGFVKEDFEMQWQLIQDLLADMNSKGYSPNIDTMNSVLCSLSLINAESVKDYALRVLAEFVNKCGIIPTLSSWYYILTIFYKERGSKCDVLHTIMDNIEGQTFKIQNPKDTLFFVTAMQICRHQLRDLKLAQRVNQLLLHDSNYNLIGDAFRENMYYRFYLTLVIQSMPIESVMEIYNDLVPHVYIPESSVMQELIHGIDLSGSCEHFPLIWSHLIMFNHSQRPSVIQQLLESMTRNLPMAEPGDSSKTIESTSDAAGDLPSKTHDSDIKSLSSFSVAENFANTAWDIWNKCKEYVSKGQKFNWNGAILSDIIMLLANDNRVADAYIVVKQLSELGSGIGVPSSPNALILFAHKAVEDGKPSNAVVAVKYLAECGFSEPPMICKELLQKILNRPQSEIEELVLQSSSQKEMFIPDVAVSDLLRLINDEKIPDQFNKGHSSSRSKDDSTSSDSDSDTSDDEFDLGNTNKSNKIK